MMKKAKLIKPKIKKNDQILLLYNAETNDAGTCDSVSGNCVC